MKRITVSPSKAPPLATKQFFENAAQTLGVKHLDDWYSIAPKSVLDLDQFGVFQKECRGYLFTGLSRAFPDHDWLAWKFQHQNVPKGFWINTANQRKFFDWFAVTTNLPSLGEPQESDITPWYNVTKMTIINAGGKAVLDVHKGSVFAALKKTYPNVEWHPWKFAQVPKRYWDDPNNQKAFFDWIGEQLKVQQLDDWYSVTTPQIANVIGYNLLDGTYGGSLFKALQSIYPEHNWLPWKFVATPHNWWKSKENQKKFVDWLAVQLNIKEPEDWYKLKCETVTMYGGATLLIMYKHSVSSLLSAMYPEHEWKAWKFETRVPKGFYSDATNVTALLDEIAKKLDVTRLDDWYRVSRKQLHELKAGALIQSKGGISKLLKVAYPDHNWDFQKLRFVGKRSSQRWLKLTLIKLFPNEEILEDYMHPKLIFTSKQPMQLDVFLPSLSLAFEYQGQQHYQDITVFSPQIRYQGRDNEKKQQCAAHKITLIEVPFWWDHKPESLAASIKQARPELLPNVRFANPIPTTPPASTPKAKQQQTIL